MRIAVVGAGISGLASAWLLSERHDVVLYEASDYLGGHTHTHDIELQGRRFAVDTGFIVHNPVHYPWLTRMFAALGVDSQATTMSFSVQNAATGLEYNATSLDVLFCQRRNLFSPRFIGMLRDLVRFYRVAPRLLDGPSPGPSLGDFLAEHRFGAAFCDEHLVPMASALWSSPAAKIMGFPAQYIVRFLANHHMLQLSRRPVWQVLRGGSRTYVDAMRTHWKAAVRLATPVVEIRRTAHGVDVLTAGLRERYDHAVLACHSDQALALLADASDTERDVLGAIPYQANDAVLHTDARLLPKNRKAWAAWNAYIPRNPDGCCTISYCMNLLQRLDAPETLVVSLNRSEAIDPDRVLRRMRYHHPVYTHASIAAQARRHEIQGRRNVWFAGAYWGWGFHEDGMRSAVEVARALGAGWPASAVATPRGEPLPAAAWASA